MKNPYRTLSQVNPPFAWEDREEPRREITNDVFRYLTRAGLSGGEYQVVFIIIDRTWGWQQKSGLVSLNQFKAGTGLSRQGIMKALKSVEAKRIIVVSRNGTKGSEYLFNQYWDTWEIPTRQPQLSSEGDQLGNQGIPSWATTVAYPRQPQLSSTRQLAEPSTEPAKVIYKVNTKVIKLKEFEVFWEAYPKKKSKGAAEKAFAKVNPDEQLLATILAKIEQAKKSADWLKDSGQFIPHPATWLNRKCWEDEFPEGGQDGANRGHPTKLPQRDQYTKPRPNPKLDRLVEQRRAANHIPGSDEPG